MKVILATVCAVLMSVGLTAGEFRSIHDSGIDPSSISIGNVGGFNSTALGTLESPTAKSSLSNEVSMYYAYLMGGEASLTATAVNFAITDQLIVAGGVVYEQSDAGFRTASSNGTVSIVEALQYMSTEYTLNGSYLLTDSLTIGVSGHYIYRDQFGVRGQGVGFSAGARYENESIGIATGGRYLNSPLISFDNGAAETRLAEYYISGKVALPFELPTDAYIQLKYTPEANALQRAGGLRCHPSDVINVSVGYMESRGIGNNLSSHVTAGIGLLLDTINVNYSYNTVDYIEANAQHRVSLSVLF
jgi:hypothetical protein